MNLSGNKPPAHVPAKGLYMLNHDLPRCNKYFEIPPLKTPNPFPVNTITAQRILTYLSVNNDPLQIPLALKLWEFYWHKERNISDIGELKQALIDCGCDEGQALYILKQGVSEEIKEKLKEATEDAKTRGAFGAPTIFVKTEDGKEEIYFGSDRFHILFPSMGILWEGPNPQPKPETNLHPKPPIHPKIQSKIQSKL